MSAVAAHHDRGPARIPTRRLTTAVILHHSEGPPIQSVEETRAFHTRPVAQGGRGWSDIAYHWLIDGQGGRHAGRAEHLVGSHCLGWSDRSIGVCALGDFDRHPMPTVQLAAVTELVAELLERYPGCQILGHREAMQRAGLEPGDRTCPGGGGLWVIHVRSAMPGPSGDELYKPV